MSPERHSTRKDIDPATLELLFETLKLMLQVSELMNQLVTQLLHALPATTVRHVMPDFGDEVSDD